MKQLLIYDTTLREGAQAAHVSFTLQEKEQIAQLLDSLGVSYIEAGNPFSNKKDLEFYQYMKEHPLQRAKLVAFGSTCRVGSTPEQDRNLAALLDTGAPAICIFGKAWGLHVRDVLRTTPEENLRIIEDSIRYLKSYDREVIFDAEHFFDGYQQDPAYALEVLDAAERAGADWLCTCDTNGSGFPHQFYEIFTLLSARYKNLGIHCHNDSGMAAANTVESVLAGARMAQVTLNGYGERCGNANLFTLIPDLQLKLGYACIPPEQLKLLRRTYIQFNNIANLPPDHRAPYVGKYAFAHKAGMHIDAIYKNPSSFEHIDPSLVGAKRSFLLSEVAGKQAVLERAQRFRPDLQKSSPELALLVDRLKELEYQGFQFEAARVSFDLEILKALGLYQEFYKVTESMVTIDSPAQTQNRSHARLTLLIGDKAQTAFASGNGPVNALDSALRSGLIPYYPKIAYLALRDYRVRVLDSKTGTASSVRVLIDWTDQFDTWTTVGASHDVVTASWKAITDALDYMLLKDTPLFQKN